MTNKFHISNRYVKHNINLESNKKIMSKQAVLASDSDSWIFGINPC